MDATRAQKILEINRKTYDLIAEDFSDTRNRIWPEMRTLVKQYVKENDRVLDVGCGNGRFLEILPRVYYFGLDNSQSLIDQAKKNNKKANFLVGDMLGLDKLEMDKFDKVFMFAVFNHIPSHELRLKALVNIFKVLKPGGHLIMTNWNLWQKGQKKSVWNREITRESFRDLMTVWQSGDKQRKGELYYRVFTCGELKKLFKQAGFEIVENYYSCGEKKCHWWNGRNILSVVKKI